jgi:hypothetical protein
LVVELSIAKSKTRLRAHRARARQRPRSNGVDLRARYEPDVPAGAGLSVVEYEDPYAPAGIVNSDGTLDVTARLEQTRHDDDSTAEGAPGWVPPPRPRIRVIANLKEDPLGRMYVRRQIDQAQFLGGRAYQEHHDAAVIGSIHSVDLEKTKVSGGQLRDPLTDRQRRAAAKLRSIESEVQRRHGGVGIALARAVLADHRPVEQAARNAGAVSDRELRSWCWLFRKILDVIALVTGFGSGLRRQSRSRNGHDDLEPADDPARHASRVELSDPELRRGRP